MTQTHRARVIAAAIERNLARPWWELSYDQKIRNNNAWWGLAYRWGVLPRVRALLSKAA